MHLTVQLRMLQVFKEQVAVRPEVGMPGRQRRIASACFPSGRNGTSEQAGKSVTLPIGKALL
jgi:hypothetical protein